MLKHAINLNKYKNRDISGEYHEEYQYLNLLSDLMKHGTLEQGRNGNVQTAIGAAMHFSLDKGRIPILTTKKTAWKTCLKELLWFIQGKMDNVILNKQNVHIWDGNSTSEFIKSRGLPLYRDGDLGPLYGFQWRYWNAPYKGCDVDYTGQGIDQLQQAIDILKDPEQRNSRRIIVSAWNPEQVDAGVLPSCHNFFQFSVTQGNKLSCTLTARSQDVFLGEPFNIASYSFLVHLIAKHCDLEPYEFILYAGNCHIYDDHFEQVKEQINRKPFDFPTIEIVNKRDNINDYSIEDFKLDNYQHHPAIKGAMRA
jgi:thymidylate synthase